MRFGVMVARSVKIVFGGINWYSARFGVMLTAPLLIWLGKILARSTCPYQHALRQLSRWSGCEAVWWRWIDVGCSSREAVTREEHAGHGQCRELGWLGEICAWVVASRRRWARPTTAPFGGRSRNQVKGYGSTCGCAWVMRMTDVAWLIVASIMHTRYRCHYVEFGWYDDHSHWAVGERCRVWFWFGWWHSIIKFKINSYCCTSYMCWALPHLGLDVQWQWNFLQCAVIQKSALLCRVVQCTIM